MSSTQSKRRPELIERPEHPERTRVVREECTRTWATRSSKHAAEQGVGCVVVRGRHDSHRLQRLVHAQLARPRQDVRDVAVTRREAVAERAGRLDSALNRKQLRVHASVEKASVHCDGRHTSRRRSSTASLAPGADVRHTRRARVSASEWLSRSKRAGEDTLNGRGTD
eukprot:scaffold94267_cov32-Tisochrysis_lutea.AAC.1